jgi:8-oxo-dGTP pyrophosphatase MutT (NUDIX family)
MVVEPQMIELAAAPFREVAAAILVTEDERYLMQLRDDLPGVSLPGHWGCFGGGLDPGETAAAAMRRELHEELGIVDAACRLYTQSVHSHPAGDPTGPPRLFRYNFFEVRIRAADEPGYDQQEGAGRALFTIEEMMALDRIAPWDLYAVLCYARHRRLFRAERYAFREAR